MSGGGSVGPQPEPGLIGAVYGANIASGSEAWVSVEEYAHAAPEVGPDVNALLLPEYT